MQVTESGLPLQQEVEQQNLTVEVPQRVALIFPTTKLLPIPHLYSPCKLRMREK